MTDQEPKPGDIRPPQRQALEEQDRLTALIDSITEPDDGFELEGTDVRYLLNAEADEEVNERRPGAWHETMSMPLAGPPGPNALMVWVWEGTPEPFKKVVLHHEVTEGLLFMQHGMKKHDAHLAARRLHEEYARAHLTPKQLQEFATWDARLEHDSSEGEEE